MFIQPFLIGQYCVMFSLYLLNWSKLKRVACLSGLNGLAVDLDSKHLNSGMFYVGETELIEQAQWFRAIAICLYLTLIPGHVISGPIFKIAHPQLACLVNSNSNVLVKFSTFVFCFLCDYRNIKSAFELHNIDLAITVGNKTWKFDVPNRTQDWFSMVTSRTKL